MRRPACISALLLLVLATASSLVCRPRLPAVRSFALFAGPRPLHQVFTVEKATPEVLKDLGVDSWPGWGTAGSEKYKVGVRSPLKIYDSNELSYITSGKVEIIPRETMTPVLVQQGDFVTFPDGFACYWFVVEEVKKKWYLY